MTRKRSESPILATADGSNLGRLSKTTYFDDSREAPGVGRSCVQETAANTVVARVRLDLHLEAGHAADTPYGASIFLVLSCPPPTVFAADPMYYSLKLAPMKRLTVVTEIDPGTLLSSTRFVAE